VRNKISAGTYSAGSDFKGSLADIVKTLQHNSDKYQENGLGSELYCQYTTSSAKNRIRRQILREILVLNKRWKRV